MRFHEMIHGVYFDDLDALQVLHNSRYILMFERAIGSFWDKLGAGRWHERQHDPDMFHLVRSNQVDYLRAIEGTGDVRVRIWVEKVGTTSLTFGFRVLPLDEDLDFATGSRVLVHVDRDTRRPAPWSADFVARLAPYRRDFERSAMTARESRPVPDPSPS
jgi:acyl-CoA thioester hydrolase